MIGIVSAGAHVPRYRLSGKTLASVWGAGGGGERAVANYDEDSLTMAAEATLNAIHGRDGRRIGACFFASTTPPYLDLGLRQESNGSRAGLGRLHCVRQESELQESCVECIPGRS
jgi:hypothetical protein